MTDFSASDGKEVKIRQLNGQVRTTIWIIAFLAAVGVIGGLLFWRKHNREQAFWKENRRVADSLALEKTRVIVQEAIWPLVLRVRELEAQNPFPADTEHLVDTTLLYEQLEQKTKEVK